MEHIEWTPLVTNLSRKNEHTFAFYPSTLPWVMVLDGAADVTLKIEVSGAWTVEDTECGPDGSMALLAADAYPMAKGVLPGALIAKLGGGSAELLPASNMLFAVGSSCVIVVPPTPRLPLFLGMNIATAKQPCFRTLKGVNKTLTVAIFEVRR
jgi:hypothetical protein